MTGPVSYWDVDDIEKTVAGAGRGGRHGCPPRPGTSVAACGSATVTDADGNPIGLRQSP